MEVISTGSLGLDLALGLGGIHKGRVVQIYSSESSRLRQSTNPSPNSNPPPGNFVNECPFRHSSEINTSPSRFRIIP